METRHNIPPLTRKKKAPVSFAKARAMRVFPVPGGPYSRIPLGGFIPMALNSWGWHSVSSTIWKREKVMHTRTHGHTHAHTHTHLLDLCQLLFTSTNVIIPDPIQQFFNILTFDWFPLTVNYRIRGNNAVRGGVCLNNLKLHCSHSSPREEDVTFAHWAITLQKVRLKKHVKKIARWDENKRQRGEARRNERPAKNEVHLKEKEGKQKRERFDGEWIKTAF